MISSGESNFLDDFASSLTLGWQIHKYWNYRFDEKICKSDGKIGPCIDGWYSLYYNVPYVPALYNVNGVDCSGHVGKAWIKVFYHDNYINNLCAYIGLSLGNSRYYDVQMIRNLYHYTVDGENSYTTNYFWQFPEGGGSYTTFYKFPLVFGPKLSDRYYELFSSTSDEQCKIDFSLKGPILYGDDVPTDFPGKESFITYTHTLQNYDNQFVPSAEQTIYSVIPLKTYSSASN